MIELTYGDRVDWYRNVRAAGGCRILLHGTEWVITGFEPMDAATGRAAFTPAQRARAATVAAQALREVRGCTGGVTNSPCVDLTLCFGAQ